MNQDQIRNWEILKQALRESPKPECFSMVRYANECGTPMCILGHYASRTDLQQHIVLRQHHQAEPDDLFLVPTWRYSGKYVYCGWTESGRLNELFGFTGSEELSPSQEADDLFGGDGCNEAETIEDALAYIDRFLEEKQKESGHAARPA